MYQFVVSFTVQPQHRDDFVLAAKKTARANLIGDPAAV